MKRIVVLAALAISFCTYAEDKPKEINTSINSVTVSLSGAQVFRDGNIYVHKGMNVYLVDDVSPFINTRGIQASGDGDYSIVDVKHNLFYPEPVKWTAETLPAFVQQELTEIEDTLWRMNMQLELIREKKNILVNQKRIINNNRLVNGQSKKDSVALLRDIVSFYDEKFNEIEIKFFGLKLDEHAVSNSMGALRQRQNELRNFKSKTQQPKPRQRVKHQVLVTVYSKKETKGKLEVSYLVNNAGWYPSYDIRANSEEEKLDFTYKGYVYQQTGEDWKDVKLKLITYDSQLRNEKPQLLSWYINYVQRERKRISSNKSYAWYNESVPQVSSEANIYESESLSSTSNFVMDVEFASADDVSFKNLEIDGIPVVNDTLKLNQNRSNHVKSAISKAFSNVEFEVELPYTIDSDGKEKLMVIDERSMEAKYTHFIVPKIDCKAYLLAQVPDWEDLNLLSAATNLYFGKTYLGQTMLNPVSLEDTMDIALGVDRGIHCSRRKIQDKEKKPLLLVGKKSKRVTIEIVVKNNKSTAVDLIVEDQIPITINEDIEIELQDVDGGRLTESTGVVSWNLKLKPQESKTRKFSDSIKYDKNEQLQ